MFLGNRHLGWKGEHLTLCVNIDHCCKWFEPRRHILNWWSMIVRVGHRRSQVLITSSPSQDYTHPHDYTAPTCDWTFCTNNERKSTEQLLHVVLRMLTLLQLQRGSNFLSPCIQVSVSSDYWNEKLLSSVFHSSGAVRQGYFAERRTQNDGQQYRVWNR